MPNGVFPNGQRPPGMTSKFTPGTSGPASVMGANNPLADKLRADARPDQRFVDHHPLVIPLLRGALGEDAYGDALAALHPIQAALEKRTQDLLASDGLRDRFPPRLPLLEADLAALGRSPMPLRLMPPPVQSHAAHIATLFILEDGLGHNLAVAHRLAYHLPHASRLYFTAGADVRRHQHFWDYAQSRFAPDNGRELGHHAKGVLDFMGRHLDSCWQEINGDWGRRLYAGELC